MLTGVALAVAAAAWWGTAWLAAAVALDLYAPVLQAGAVAVALGALQRGFGEH
jgi:hypothetical protein